MVIVGHLQMVYMLSCGEEPCTCGSDYRASGLLDTPKFDNNPSK